MPSYQEQAEQEMWDAASRHYEDRSYRYQVQAPDTGAICMNTDSLREAQVRADLMGGVIIDIQPDPLHGPGSHPDYDARVDYPERYSDERPI